MTDDDPRPETPERAPHEVTPGQAAPMLGLSRGQVEMLLDRGVLAHRTIGAERLIATASIQAFQASERERSRAAMADFSALQTDLGLVDEHTFVRGNARLEDLPARPDVAAEVAKIEAEIDAEARGNFED